MAQRLVKVKGTETELIAPVVHMNGSGKKSLQEALREAVQKCRDTCDALMQTVPHGRDYYVQDDVRTNASYERARDEFLSRVDRVRSVERELTALYFDLDQQGKRE